MKKLSLDELGRVTPEIYKTQEKNPIVIILDNIRSMYNVGSIFRTADAFAVEKIFLCGITAQPPHKEIEKTALGATETVYWQYYENTKELITLLKQDNYKIYAVEQTDEPQELTQFSFSPEERYAVVMGNEVFGVDDEVLNLCDGAIEIPQVGVKHSLNVSVAAAIVIWEFFRQMKK
ncbi:MAG TPA: RNA methyltransferase [Bacteroidales bacterium]|jgi:tRNA G18 (ribose-2'-O)-methylase SpoU|nr:RNA methyltransferase [Bacteroidales bacterium]HOS58273.1 RNA methyltransferase [Bacteroidales bacterium]HPY80352.1 RNA methyltransferase [Bacteroidales bacterium]HQA86864.1 RNA methyltransferase [Bacteroidales bacterium]HRR04752.1 RNA methyltransferase [Bacteroidales bacterium]